jgi:DEAD/DEAH box helicase domain-containing protein
VSAECLRLAFISTKFKPSSTRSGSVHGNFGEATEWKPDARVLISGWLATSPVVDKVATRLSAHTGVDLAKLVAYVRSGLVAEIDRVAEGTVYTQVSLSERLANAGILPMFGFPTRVRSLLKPSIPGTGGSSTSRGDDEVTSRQSDIAVSQFAPGAETLKDGEVFRSVGFAEYLPGGGGSRYPHPNPLGEPRYVVSCAACNSIESVELGADPEEPEDLDVACGTCGRENTVFKLYEPLGYKSDRPRDYSDDGLERGSQLGFPRLATKSDPGKRDTIKGISFAVHSQEDVYSINDNNGRFFGTVRDRSGAWVVPDAFTNEKFGDQLSQQPVLAKGAIGSVRPTDVLLIELDRLDKEQVPGTGYIETRPAELPAGLAGLWSFAEAFRLASVATMDVEPLELQIGLQPVAKDDGGRTHRVFIADSLENGAGYSTRLGQRELLSEILGMGGETSSKMLELLTEFDEPEHADTCMASCHECLRSYDNRFLHSMLDWRLAADVAEVATGRQITLDRWLRLAPRLVSSMVTGYALSNFESVQVGELQAIHSPSNGRLAFFGHPLWRSDSGLFVPMQKNAAEGSSHVVGENWRYFDLFTLVYRPAKIFAWLTAS